MATALKDIREYYLNRIEPGNVAMAEVVERYVNLVQKSRRINTEINKLGIILETKNSNQKFEKSNPALGDYIKINGQISNTQKIIEQHIKEYKKVIADIELTKEVRNEEYDEDDLLDDDDD